MNLDLLKRLLAANKLTGEHTNDDVIRAYINGYAALDKYRNSEGAIDVEHALAEIKKLL